MTAQEKLKNKNDQGKFICVGLDTDINKIPKELLSAGNPVLEFNRSIIESTQAHAAAFKLNFAFYEAHGAEGFETLKATIDAIPNDILIIGDAKRGDIGNTSQMYAQSIFENFRCDASTLHPYMGGDSIKPFLDDPDKLNFILVLTSNPGNADFEKLKLENGDFVYQAVLRKVREWNDKKNCGIVFGATNASELKDNMENIGDLPVLLPGVGAQGGSLEDVVKIFEIHRKNNYIINVSRGIIYSGSGKDFAEAAQTEIIRLNKEINSLTAQ